MSLSERQKKIILILLEEKRELTGELISRQLGKSLRTIQNDIYEINQDFPKLIASTNKGYSVNPDQLSSNQLELETNYLEEKKIQQKIIFSLTPLNIDSLAEEFFMSTSLLNKHLKKFKKQLNQFDLNLAREQNMVFIKGEEYNKRLFIRDMIFSEIGIGHKSLDAVTGYLTTLDSKHIESIVISTIKKFNYYIETPYLTNLLINVLITLSRIETSKLLENKNFDISTNSIEYKIAKEICERLQFHWYVEITDKDIEYIAISIEGQIKSKETINPINENYQETIRIKLIIQKVFNYYLLNLDYEEILPNFIKHIEALLKRGISKQFVASNIISTGIRETAPFIYDVAVYLTKLLEDEFNIKIPADEIGLLSIYIGYVIEQSSPKSQLIKIGLCCPDYHHFSSKLMNQLKEIFSNQIQIVFVEQQIPTINQIEKVDLIISTIKFNCMGKNFVLISPFFSDSEKNNVMNEINLIQKNKDNEENKRILSKCFNKELFFKNKGIKTKKESIDFLGQALVDEGICTTSFINSVHRREQLSSTCFFNLFAVPHAIELNATKTQIAVLIEEKGVEWDPDISINCIFMIAVCREDRKKFMKLYNSIIQVLCNPISIHDIITTGTFDDFLDIFIQR
ncbi:transcription antiterminator [Enterococcus faecium]